MTYEWVAPAYLDAVKANSLRGVLARTTSAPDTLIRTSARSCFGRLTMTPLQHLARNLEVDVKGCDLCETIRRLVHVILPDLDDDGVIKILKMRIDKVSVYEDLVLDEDWDAAEEEDSKEIETMKDEVEKKGEQQRTFKSAIHKLVVENTN